MKCAKCLGAIVFLLLQLCLCARISASEITYCIDPGHQPMTLSGALNFWANDSTALQVNVKVVGGTFSIAGEFDAFVGAHPDSLVLMGGYKPNTNCDEAQRNITANATTLDGGGNAYLYLSATSPMWIDGVTFDNYLGQLPTAALYQGVRFETAYSSVTLTRFIARRVLSVELSNAGHFSSSAFPSLLISDCLIYDQPSTSTFPVGALYLDVQNAHATVRNCTVTGNPNGGVQMETEDDGVIDVYNTISYANGNQDFFNGSFISNTPNVHFSFYATGFGFNTYSNIHPPASNWQLFASSTDYHLAQQSIAINQGDPGLAYGSAVYPGGLEETDLDGNLRVAGGRADIGAYESNFVPNQYIVNRSIDDGNVGSFRWALNQANAHPAAVSTIVFDMPFPFGSGCPIIVNLDALLPDIVSPVLIDARTQPGWSENTSIGAFSGTLCVRLTSGTGSPLQWAFHVPASASKAQLVAEGFIFDRFALAPVYIEAGSGHSIGGSRFSGPGLAGNTMGIYVTGQADGVQIGGRDPQFANVIGNTTLVGIYLGNAAGNNSVEGNLIGTAPDGTTPAANPYGIYISGSAGNRIDSNYIGFSSNDGIYIGGVGSVQNEVSTNSIGWDFFGSMPNARYGVNVDSGAHDNRIGEITYSKPSNSIRDSGSAGVMISSSAGSGNQVLGNNLVGNGGPSANNGLAIDLGDVGPERNTSLGASNYPVLRSSLAFPSHQLIGGSIDGAANTIYRVEFHHLYTTPTGYTGRGDAGLFAGANSVPLLTDAAGHCSFLVSLPQVQVGGYMTATATDMLGGNTSEIGNAVADATDDIFLDSFSQSGACQ